MVLNLKSFFDLSGEWFFKKDTEKVGIHEKWFNKKHSDTISLPGTMEESGFGNKNEDLIGMPSEALEEFMDGDVPRKKHLQGLHHTYGYKGMAWYVKEVDIDEALCDKCITLFLERCQWETSLYIDGIYIGSYTSLAAPHIYDLSDILTPGRHVIAVMCDNSNEKIEADEKITEIVKDGQGRDINIHLTTNNTQVKLACGGHMESYPWNGIIGKLGLWVNDKVRIRQADIFPDVKNGMIKIKLEIGNTTKKNGSGILYVKTRNDKNGTQTEYEDVIKFSSDEVTTVERIYKLEDEFMLWSINSPILYTANIEFRSDEFYDKISIQFGMREFTAEGTQFKLNGKTVFLRGDLGGYIEFPLTAYPPYKDASFWNKMYKTYKAYGINHLRFHSFCPPEIALTEADKAGMICQVEIPGTSCPIASEDENVQGFLFEEFQRILKWCGNHPSFCLMGMGNEQLIINYEEFLVEHIKVLNKRVEYGQKNDPRHLYTGTAHPPSFGRSDDFFVAATNGKYLEDTAQGRKFKNEIPLNGIMWGGPDPLEKSRFCISSPNTITDYSEGIKDIDIPVVTHEVGQWAVYPNVFEAPKYNGVFRANNLELIKESLKRKGLLRQAKDFVKASGQLSLLLYKEEIESALRTDGLAGFQLLSLTDYPGQGTSTVGILDVFFNSKGLIAADGFKQFCSDIVPLLKMEKRVYKSDEVFKAGALIANYSENEIKNAIINLNFFDEKGEYRCGIRFAPRNIPAGGLYTVDEEILIELNRLEAPAKYKICMEIETTDFKNEWDIWLYPSELPAEKTDVKIYCSFNGECIAQLEKGENVLLILKECENSIPGVFTTAFWNPIMKPQVGTMGIFCDPAHPMFNNFPTDYYTNWQWWDIIENTICINLESVDINPSVQMIDSFITNRKLGVVFECRAGKGKLLVCGIDITCGGTVINQFKKSMLNYLDSEDFNPEKELDIRQLEKILK